MLRAAFLLLLAFVGTAAAQEPRIVLSTELPASDGAPQRYSQRRALSVGRDGTLLAAMERGAVVADAAGQIRTRFAFPSPERRLAFVCVVAIDQDDLAAVFQQPDDSPTPGLSLFHHGADGKLLGETLIPPPPEWIGPNGKPAGAIYNVEQCSATADRALLLAGSYGTVRNAGWWFGKINLAGSVIFQTNNPVLAERVAAAATRPDGGIDALVQVRAADLGGQFQWYLHRYAESGRRERARIDIPRGYAASMMGSGGIIAADELGLFLVDENGRLLRQSSWPFHRTGVLVGAGASLWATGSFGDHEPDWLVRINERGTLYHYRTRLNIAAVAGAPADQLAALLVSDDGKTVRLVRFDR